MPSYTSIRLGHEGLIEDASTDGILNLEAKMELSIVHRSQTKVFIVHAVLVLIKDIVVTQILRVEPAKGRAFGVDLTDLREGIEEGQGRYSSVVSEIGAQFWSPVLSRKQVFRPVKVSIFLECLGTS